MKVILTILSGIILLMNSAFIQDKTAIIQQELIATIQKDYVNWLTNKKDYAADIKDLNVIHDDSLSIISNNDSSTIENYPPGTFQDFKFKITNRQAVVQFSINNLVKSAFFEKKDGTWKLVCCADLAPNL